MSEKKKKLQFIIQSNDFQSINTTDTLQNGASETARGSINQYHSSSESFHGNLTLLKNGLTHLSEMFSESFFSSEDDEWIKLNGNLSVTCEGHREKGPLGSTAVCTKFHGYPSVMCQNRSVWTRAVFEMHSDKYRHMIFFTILTGVLRFSGNLTWVSAGVSGPLKKRISITPNFSRLSRDQRHPELFKSGGSKKTKQKRTAS